MKQRQPGWSSDMDMQDLLEVAKNAAVEAGAEILRIYGSGDLSIEAKSDQSPLTRADKAAHHKIVSFLESTNFPILSEEGREIPYDERSKWEYFWMVDPLDGTREFIKKNGEFTVNIALIHAKKPVLGVVYIPVTGELYRASGGDGAHKECNGTVERIHTTQNPLTGSGTRVAASRSHMNKETETYIGKFNNPHIVSRGSSLKFLLVASGRADVYPRFAPTMEWDTAAAHAIVNEAGGRVTLTDEITPLTYNKPNLLNPYFIVKST